MAPPLPVPLDIALSGIAPMLAVIITNPFDVAKVRPSLYADGELTSSSSSGPSAAADIVRCVAGIHWYFPSCVLCLQDRGASWPRERVSDRNRQAVMIFVDACVDVLMIHVTSLYIGDCKACI